MHLVSRTDMFAFLILLSSTVVIADEQSDTYRAQYEAAERELQPRTLTGENLVELLEADKFFHREVVSGELRRRGLKHLALVVEASKSTKAERRHRASYILSAFCISAHESIREQRNPKFTMNLENVHFNDGPPGLPFGLQRLSLEAKILFGSTVPIEELHEPLPVLGAITDRGEFISELPDPGIRLTSSCYSVSLRRPLVDFKEVNVTVLISGLWRCDEKHSDAFEARTHEVRKDISVLNVTEKDDCFVIEALDALGRLEKAELVLFTNDGKSIDPKRSGTSSPFHRYWTVSKQDKPARFDFTIANAKIVVECAEQVTIPYPDGR